MVNPTTRIFDWFNHKTGTKIGSFIQATKPIGLLYLTSNIVKVTKIWLI